ncbi:MAG TPA: fatty acid oxidation complex subunit alpha FadB [Steroidobacteraceae bacterium]|nr:fatty acid oxidation complex subunit alpha FadB [Steroidobacteraceae bacterium]
MIFQGHSIRVQLRDGGIAELCFDAGKEAINKLDLRTIEELAAATQAVAGTDAVRGVLVTSAKETFIVGADIFEFTTLFARPANEIATEIARRNSIFTAFEDLEIPSVAAINGLALGGGLEMALACDGRVISATAQVGLPEVSLGLFPGFGGTVRLPRLAGAATAIEWISTGKQHKPASALAAHVVDRISAPDALYAEATQTLSSLIRSGEWRSRRRSRHGPFNHDSRVFLEAKERLAKSSAHQPAALAAVELMDRAAASSRNEALELEHVAFSKIARTQAAGSLIQLFISDQTIKKKGREYGRTARKVQRAAVIGAGIMGGGIAYTSAVRGIPVLMKDIQQGALDVGLAEAKKLLAKQVESGRLSADRAATVLGDIQATLEYPDLRSTDVVVEAVVENLQVKKAVLAEVERLAGPDTILASNTSSLSISEMARALRRPENLVGMHFFNPVPLMPLVEVVCGARTSERAAATIAGYANALGKAAIVVKECPGFLVNRILTPYLLGFLQAIHAGADYLQIDRVMEAFGWPMGPAYLQDVIGMDTLLHVLDAICAGFPDRMRIPSPHAVQRLLQLGRLGQKSGQGFYRYEPDPKGRPRKSVDPTTAQLLADGRATSPPPFSDQELLERLMLPMVIEAARCLEERIVASAAELDMSLILGLGFPRHVGGPLKYADWLGMKHVVERCDAHATLGPLYAPTEQMRTAARTGRMFY